MPPEKKGRLSGAKPVADRPAGSRASQVGQEGGEVLGEVYFELRPVGNYMRVDAIHAATGTETYVLGPLNSSRSNLKMLALRKLKRMLKR